MATFITSKAIGESISIAVVTTTTYWKYIHGGSSSQVYMDPSGFNPATATITDTSGEFTILSCDAYGEPSGFITKIISTNQNITSFDTSGLSSLTSLTLSSNQLSEFSGEGLESITHLYLDGNPLTSFGILNNPSAVPMNQNLNYLNLVNCGLTPLTPVNFPSNIEILFVSDNNLNFSDSISSYNFFSGYNISNMNITGNNISNLGNDGILQSLVESMIQNGSLVTDGTRTVGSTENFYTLVNERGWTIGDISINTSSTTSLMYQTYDGLPYSSDFFTAPVNAVVNFDPSTKGWSVYATGSSGSGGGGLIGPTEGGPVGSGRGDAIGEPGAGGESGGSSVPNYVNLGNIGTLTSIDNGDGTWQVIYRFAYDFPSNYTDFQVRSDDGQTILSVRTALVEFTSQTNIEYIGEVFPELNWSLFININGIFTEYPVTGSMIANLVNTNLWNIEFNYSALSTTRSLSSFVRGYQNYGLENQTILADFVVTTVVETTTTTTTTEAPTTTTTTTSGSTPTFITSKAQGESIFIDITTSTGYWKVEHDNNILLFNSSTTLTVGSSGDFTIWSVDGGTGEPFGDITYLNLESQNITNFNGSLLTNLQNLNLQNNGLTSIANFVFPPSLVYLSLVGNQLQPFDFSTLTSLEALHLDNNSLTSVDNFVFPSNLLQLGLEGNGLTSFDGTSLTNLTNLYLNNNGITSLVDFIFPTNLTNLYLDNNGLTSFDGTGLSNLVELGLVRNQLASFVSNGLSNLTSLNLSMNPLTSFDGSAMTSLNSLDLFGCGITSLENFTFPSSLTNLNFYSGKGGNNYISSFDPSGLPNLTFLELRGNPMTPEANDFILDKLEAAGLSNGSFYTSNGRTSAGDSDFVSLILRNWNLQGAGDEPVETTTTTTEAPNYRALVEGVSTSHDFYSYFDEILVREFISGQAGSETFYFPVQLDSSETYLDDRGNEKQRWWVTFYAPSTGDYRVYFNKLQTLPMMSQSMMTVYFSELAEFIGQTTTTTTEEQTTTTTTTSGLTPTFVTSKSVGGWINISAGSSVGPYKVYHDGAIVLWNGYIARQGQTGIYITNPNGEVTIIPCDIDGNETGVLTQIYLDSGDNSITSFNGTGLTGLTHLYLSNNQLTSLTLDGLNSLQYLLLNNNSQLTSLTLNGLDSLIRIEAQSCALVEFNYDSLPSLENLNLNQNQLTSIDVTGLSNLANLYLDGNQLTSISLSGLSNLGNLSIQNNQLTELTLSDLPNLIGLQIGGNPMVTLSISNLPLITELSLSGFYSSASTIGSNRTLTSVSLSGLDILSYLDLSNNLLTSLDVSGITSLTNLNLTNNAITSLSGFTFSNSLTSLNLSKNQLSSVSGLGLTNLQNLYLDVNVLETSVPSPDPGAADTVVYSNLLTSFDGSDLTSLTSLTLKGNKISSLDNFIFPNSLTYLSLGGGYVRDSIRYGQQPDIFNSLTSFTLGLSNLETLDLSYNQLTSFDSLPDGMAAAGLSILLNNNGITSLTNFNFPVSLMSLNLNSNNFTSFDGTGLPGGIEVLTIKDNSSLSSVNVLGLSNLRRLNIQCTELRNFHGEEGGHPVFRGLVQEGGFIGQIEGGIGQIGGGCNIPITPEMNDQILSQLAQNGYNFMLVNSSESDGFWSLNGRTSASTNDYNTLISRGWNLRGVDLPEETTTTTTTEAPSITDYALTFRKISYGGNSPKNAPLTISEFEGNFAYLSDYVNHLLNVIDTLNVTITELESQNQSLANRVTNLENSGGGTEHGLPLKK